MGYNRSRVKKRGLSPFSKTLMLVAISAGLGYMIAKGVDHESEFQLNKIQQFLQSNQEEMPELSTEELERATREYRESFYDIDKINMLETNIENEYPNLIKMIIENGVVSKTDVSVRFTEEMNNYKKFIEYNTQNNLNNKELTEIERINKALAFSNEYKSLIDKKIIELQKTRATDEINNLKEELTRINRDIASLMESRFMHNDTLVGNEVSLNEGKSL